MSLIDELREYLRGVERGVTAGAAPTVGIDMPSARRYFVDALERRERSHGMHSVEASFWDRERRDGFLRDLEAELRAGPCAEGDAATFRMQTEDAIDLLVGLPGPSLSRTRARELGQIVTTLARATWVGKRRFDVARYAMELRLVRSRGAQTEVSPIGQVLTRMPEADAVHWLLTVETLQSLGPSDVYRMPIQAVIALDRHPEGTFHSAVVSFDDDRHHADTGERWLLDHGIVERLESIGLLDQWSKPDERTSGYTVRTAFLPMIAEIASQKPTPFSVLAETLIAEERGAVLPRTATGAEGITDTATLALERHSRMVAHELHNSIVPVQHALQKLSDVLAQSAPDDQWKVYQQRISRNVERVLRFATEMAETSTLAVKPIEPFDVALAIRDALAELNGGLATRVQFGPPDELPAVRGHRHRFVMVMVNLLRNAVQSVSDREVKLRIDLGQGASGQVQVAVHDDGPGVEVPYRDAIFQRSFALRPGGSGQGLSLVRDVVEGEMGGSVRYEPSDLGGACFVLLLPGSSRRSP